MDLELFDRLPLPMLTTRLLWEAVVEIGPREDLGSGPLGPRGIVPILGGAFRGGPGFEALSGKVRPGGADRQLARPDGARELDALYEMQVADRDVLTIRNRVLIDETRSGERYALSRIEVAAPAGEWSWLSRRIILGTLQPLTPEQRAVAIRAWLADHDVAKP
jgi:hypothetical protein